MQASLSQLQNFLAVARHRSFSRAARELGVSAAAVSKSVKQLEEQLGVVLLTRTTRSVSPTDAGTQLIADAGPAMKQAQDALVRVAAKPGEVVGRLKLSVGRMSMPFLVSPVLPLFRERHPRIDVEIVVDERLVDLVGEGFDAVVRLSESIDRDMVQLRVTDPFRFVMVGAPAYLKKYGTPHKPEDLLRHECIGFRAPSTGALYAWELEKGRRNWRVPVRGSVITNEPELNVLLAEQGLGLTYTYEPWVTDLVRRGRLEMVLEAYAAQMPGFFLCYPSKDQSSPALRLFVEVVKEFASSTKRRRS
ncbi:MAG TPA: LysR family transcriptional regulator [Kofleriaceae bacterium]